MKNQRLFFASVFLVFAGCGIYETKTTGGSVKVDTNALTNPDHIVSYAEVRDAVFVSCVDCHGPTKQKKGIRLDSFALVIQYLDKVKQTAIVERSMPTDGPLSDDQTELLQKWITQGTPEQGSGGVSPQGSASPAPTVAPTPAPVQTPTPNPDQTPTPSPSGTPAALIAYASVRDQVFTPSCVSCHGPVKQKGGVRLDSFSDVIKNLAGVKETVFGDQSMPDDGPMTDAQNALLLDWINQGAPETILLQASPTVTPTPVPTPSAPVLLPTYQSIHDLVFVPKCLKCHTTGGSASDVPLEPYDAMMKVPGVVTPKDITLSSLVQETQITPPRTSPSMPPKRSGISPLTDDELTAVKTWINNGAQP